MSGWPNLPTGPEECQMAFANLIKTFVPRGRLVVKHYYCKQGGGPVRGWACHHCSNPWGKAAPAEYLSEFYYPEGAGWLTYEIFDRFDYAGSRVPPGALADSP
jgi:alpha-L-fucosidase 2